MSASEYSSIHHSAALGYPLITQYSYTMDSPTSSSASSPSPAVLSLKLPSPTSIFEDPLSSNLKSPKSFFDRKIKREPMYSPALSPIDFDNPASINANSFKSEAGSPLSNIQDGSPTDTPSDSRQRPKPQDELCHVCGDRASGYHYNALACEGCKGFFRRSITQSKSSKYLCKYGDSCEIDMYMRRKCQACRLKKCYTVGMRSDCVVPEEQCRKKRQEKKDLRSSTPSASVQTLLVTYENDNQTRDFQLPDFGSKPQPDQDFLLRVNHTLYNRSLKPEQEELINRLVYFQEEFEQPSEEDLKKVYHVPLCSSNSDIDESESLFRHITEITILTVQLIVQFSRHLPGFQTLKRADQVILLKACSSEVMMIRASRRYEIQSDSIVFATNHPFTRDHYVKAGLDNEALFQFCRRMSKMKVDNAEYGLLTAITIFCERRNLCEPHRVEKIQEIYVDALQAYMQVNRRKQPMVALAKMLSILSDLRSLGNNNSRQCFDLKLLANRKLPQFLAEIWDIV